MFKWGEPLFGGCLYSRKCSNQLLSKGNTTECDALIVSPHIAPPWPWSTLCSASLYVHFLHLRAATRTSCWFLRFSLSARHGVPRTLMEGRWNTSKRHRAISPVSLLIAYIQYTEYCRQTTITSIVVAFHNFNVISATTSTIIKLIVPNTLWHVGFNTIVYISGNFLLINFCRWYLATKIKNA